MRKADIAEVAWDAARLLHAIDKRGQPADLRAAVDQAEVAAWRVYDEAVSLCWEQGLFPCIFGGLPSGEGLLYASITDAGLHARRDLAQLWERRSGVTIDWPSGLPGAMPVRDARRRAVPR